MDIEKLIETLRQRGVAYVRAYGRYCSICDEVVTALSTLQAENEKLRAEADGMRSNWYKAVEEIKKLRAELEQVKRELDTAIKDLNEFLSMDELCPIQCEWCKWNSTYCDGKTPEWRGIKEN